MVPKELKTVHPFGSDIWFLRMYAKKIITSVGVKVYPRSRVT